MYNRGSTGDVEPFHYEVETENFGKVLVRGDELVEIDIKGEGE